VRDSTVKEKMTGPSSKKNQSGLEANDTWHRQQKVGTPLRMKKRKY